MTVRRFAPFLLLGLIACRDAGAPSAELVPLLEIIDGNGQVDTVAKQLPIAITARAEDKLSAQPARGVVLNWFRVVGSDSAFIGAAITNDSGVARLRPTLGTKAGAQTFIAWALDGDGQRSEHAAATATALPDRAVRILTPGDTVRVWVGEPLRSGAYASVWDQFMNFVGAPAFTPATGWTVRADTAWPATEIRSDLSLVYDNLRATLAVIALRDLRRHRWKLQYTCGDTVATGVATVKADPALWYWTVQWVNLQAVADSVTLFEWAPHRYGFDLWFSRATLIRGLSGLLLDGTQVHSTDTNYDGSRLRIAAQDIGWIRPAWYETRPGRSFGGSPSPAYWNGMSYVGSDLRLCQQSAFEDFPNAVAGAGESFHLALETIP
jgi:hypothetical protein